MIKDFRDSETEELWQTGKSRRLPADLRVVALRKLLILHRASDLNDLAVPGGNHLELLRGDRKGRHSIRINDRYRLCFLWREADAFEVEIVDYH